jgi:hydrogenase expression/formation protein HypC
MRRIMCLAVPGRLVEIAVTDAAFPVGRVSFDGVLKEVSLAFVPEARAGDYVLVHVGVALNVIDAAEAARVFEDLRALGELPERDTPVPGHEVPG